MNRMTPDEFDQEQRFQMLYRNNKREPRFVYERDIIDGIIQNNPLRYLQLIPNQQTQIRYGRFHKKYSLDKNPSDDLSGYGKSRQEVTQSIQENICDEFYTEPSDVKHKMKKYSTKPITPSYRSNIYTDLPSMQVSEPRITYYHSVLMRDDCPPQIAKHTKHTNNCTREFNSESNVNILQYKTPPKKPGLGR